MIARWDDLIQRIAYHGFDSKGRLWLEGWCERKGAKLGYLKSVLIIGSYLWWQPEIRPVKPTFGMYSKTKHQKPMGLINYQPQLVSFFTGFLVVINSKELPLSGSDQHLLEGANVFYGEGGLWWWEKAWAPDEPKILCKTGSKIATNTLNHYLF